MITNKKNWFYLTGFLTLLCLGLVFLLILNGGITQSGNHQDSSMAEQADRDVLARGTIRVDPIEDTVGLQGQPVRHPLAPGTNNEGKQGLVEIRGIVVDNREIPVSNAQVLVIPIAQKGAAKVDSLSLEKVTRHETQTGPKGKFCVTDVRPGTILLGARAPGFGPVDRFVEFKPGPKVYDIGSLTLHRGVSLIGRVVDSSGHAFQGARILRVDGGPALSRNRLDDLAYLGSTDRDGGFRVAMIAVGKWQLMIESNRHPPMYVRGQCDKPGVQHIPLIQMHDGAVISGKVISADDVDLRGLSVRAKYNHIKNLPKAIPLSTRVQYVSCDSDGRFVFRRLPVTEGGSFYQLRVLRKGLGGLEFLSESKRVMSGSTDIILRLPKSSSLSFHVVDVETGAQIDQPHVSFSVFGSEEFYSSNIDPVAQGTLETQPDGKIKIKHIGTNKGLSTIHLKVDKKGYCKHIRKDVEIVSGQDLEIDSVRLVPRPLLQVHVVDAETQEPIADANVYMAASSVLMESTAGSSKRGGDQTRIDYASPRETVSSDGSGRATIPLLHGDLCKIIAWHPDYAPCDPMEVQGRRGELPELRLELDRGARVSVSVHDIDGDRPLAGIQVEHRPDALSEIMQVLSLDMSSSQITNEQGIAVFDRLAPIRHWFRTLDRPSQSPQEGWSYVELVGNSDLEMVFHCQMSDQLVGRLTENGVPFPGAKLILVKEGNDEHVLQLRQFGDLAEAGLLAESDDAGRFFFENVVQGNYTLDIWHRLKPVTSHVKIIVEKSSMHLEVDLPISTVAGRVTDEQNRPIRDACLCICYLHETDATLAKLLYSPEYVARLSDLNKLATFRSEADGSYRLSRLPCDISLVILAVAEGRIIMVSDPFQLQPNEVLVKNLIMPQCGGIEVQVLNAEGQKPRMGNLYSLVAVRLDAAAKVPTIRRMKPDRNGYAVFTHLSGGRWQVGLDELMRKAFDVKTQEVEVVVGQVVRVILQLPPSDG